MIQIKNAAELQKMRKACAISAAALKAGGEAIEPGITTAEIDKIIYDFIVRHGARPNFLHLYGFPATACISVNDTVIHGIPNKQQQIRPGDIDTENPINLVVRSMIFLLLIWYCDDIVNLALQIGGTPYNWILDSSLPGVQFGDFNSVLLVIIGVIANGSVALIALILVVILAWNYLKLLLEAAERYVVLGILVFTAPLAFAMGAARGTNNIFKSWCRMFGGQLLLLIMNAWCVLINVGDGDTAHTGGKVWEDPDVSSAVKGFVHRGGGLIGVGEPGGHQYQGRYLQLSAPLGVEKETGFTLNYDKYNWDEHRDHFILTDCPDHDVDFGEGKKSIFALEGTEILIQRDKEVQMAAHEYGKGRGVYISGLPYSFVNNRVLYRAILWAAHDEADLHKWFSTNYNVEVHAYVKNGKYCVVNNTYEPQDTTVYTGDGSSFDLHMDANEIKWYNL